MGVSRAPDLQLRRDLIKLACLSATIAGVVALFVLTPSLSSPTLISVVIAMVLSPLVSALERRGYSRSAATLLLFGMIGLLFALLSYWTFQSVEAEWESFKTLAPERFRTAMAKLKEFETTYRARYSILKDVRPTAAIVAWGESTGQWFVVNGASIVGNLLTWLLIVPPLSYVLLNDGRELRKQFFQLVPNRFFESFFSISHQVLSALSDYLRAKIVEGSLVGLLTGIGLLIVGAPYVAVLSVLAGITNIIPYLGPILGALPGLLVVAFEPTQAHLLLPIAIVYGVANVIDMALIFPVVVAKLVNLHPVILIAVVIVGQEYYGLIGMLLATPVAAAVKVVLTEIYALVYEDRSMRPAAGLGEDSGAATAVVPLAAAAGRSRKKR